MRNLSRLAAVLAVGCGLQSAAFGYTGTANVTFSWATAGTDRGWTSGGVNSLAAMTNDTWFSLQPGANMVGFYNSDFATPDGCAAAVADPSNTLGWNGGTISVRKYGCRFSDYSSNPSYLASPTGNINTPAPDLGPGASASGTITITDTTLTGTLTVTSTTDEPTGGTAANVGLGASGYNLRNNDGSPFGNSWMGVSTGGQYVLNLTGTFTSSSWQITGGTARFTDGGFLCQQGGHSTPANILCSASTQAGGYQTNGAALSWGWDPDGSGASTTMSQIEVRGPGDAFVASLSGVLASLSVDVNGNITTNQAEVRRAIGSSACGGAFIKYDGRITCGTLTVANLVVSGTAVTDLEDDVPGPFSFTDQGNVALGTLVTSGSVAIGGMNIPSPISVSGAPSGEYSIDGGPFTSAAGMVSSGSTVRVRHTSSPFPDTGTDTVLNVGGVTDTFTSTTLRYAIDDTASTSTGVPVEIAVLANDLAFPDPVYAGVWVDPLHGTATVSGSPGPQAGIRITYTPNPGYAGPDSFQYWVEGGTVADYGLVTISVIFNDTDGDGTSDPADNCPLTSNPGQEDGDGDGVGNACDNCTERANASQWDSNGDGYGNICDADLNNSGLVTAADYAILRSRLSTTDADADLSGNGLVTALDYTILRSYLGLPPGPSGLHP